MQVATPNLQALGVVHSEECPVVQAMFRADPSPLTEKYYEAFMELRIRRHGKPANARGLLTAVE